MKLPLGDSLWTGSAHGNATASGRRDGQAQSPLPLMVKIFALAAQVQPERVESLPQK